MAVITLGTVDYDGFTTVAFADGFLAADAALHAVWAGADANTKSRSIISASRYFLDLCWEAGTPPAFDPLDADVQEACAVMAALIVQEPGLITGTSGAVNGQTGAQDVKRAKAGSAEVEFFDPIRKDRGRQDVLYAAESSLPGRVRGILSRNDLLCKKSTASIVAPFNGQDSENRCHDATEGGLTRPFS